MFFLIIIINIIQRWRSANYSLVRLCKIGQSKWAFWRGGESKVKEAPKKRLVSITKVSLQLGFTAHKVYVVRMVQDSEGYKLIILGPWTIVLFLWTSQIVHGVLLCGNWLCDWSHTTTMTIHIPVRKNLWILNLITVELQYILKNNLFTQIDVAQF